MRKQNIALGSSVLVFTAIYCIMITRLPEKARTYPIFIAGLLCVLSLTFLIKSIIEKPKDNEEKVSIFADFQKKQYIFVLCTAFIYVALINLLGYFAATFIYLIVSLFGLKINKLQSVLISVGFCLVIYIGFKLLLKVPLPAGLII